MDGKGLNVLDRDPDSVRHFSINIQNDVNLAAPCQRP